MPTTAPSSGWLSSYYSYSDVLLVCNPANQISVDVCNYFTNARISQGFNPSYVVNLQNIPAQEYVSNTVTQEILSQVKSGITKITASGGKIDYIVTTYGVPLVDTTNELSIDSLLSNDATYTQTFETNLNPYYEIASSYLDNSVLNYPVAPNSNGTFSHANYNMYEVTRLDGPTLQSIYNLINNADNAAEAYSQGYVLLNGYTTETGLVGDVPYLFGYTSYFLNSTQPIPIKNTQQNSYFVTNTGGISGYISWGSHACNQATSCADSAAWGLSFIPGAIGMTFVSSSGRTLYLPWPGTGAPQPYGDQSLISDLVVQGITGVSGYVYEPYIGVPNTCGGTIESPYNVFQAYYSGYTLADSYYNGMCYMGDTRTVVIGDPKAHVRELSPYISVTISPIYPTVNPGQSVTFTSKVSGGIGPYTYQWYITPDTQSALSLTCYGSTPINGATSSSYTYTVPSGASTGLNVCLEVKSANGGGGSSNTGIFV